MLTHSFATIQEVSGSLPPTARFVIFPSATLGDLSSSEQLEHFQSLDIPGDFYVGAQSSEHSWFDFTSERLSFELYYDTTSDNLVFKNQGRLQLTLDALGPDDTEGPGNHQSVPPHSCVELSPGLWRVSDTDEEQAGLCDLLLMERRYSAKVIIPELEAAPVRRRKPRKAAQQVKQRIRLMKVNKVPTVSTHTTIPSGTYRCG